MEREAKNPSWKEQGWKQLRPTTVQSRRSCAGSQSQILPCSVAAPTLSSFQAQLRPMPVSQNSAYGAVAPFPSLKWAQLRPVADLVFKFKRSPGLFTFILSYSYTNTNTLHSLSQPRLPSKPRLSCLILPTKSHSVPSPIPPWNPSFLSPIYSPSSIVKSPQLFTSQAPT